MKPVTFVSAIISVAALVSLDLPATVRVKAIVVKALPLSDRQTIELIQDLCFGAYRKSSWSADNCYYSNFDRKAHLSFNQSHNLPVQCSELMEDIVTNPQNWIEHHNKAAGYFTYVGKGAKPGLLDNTYNLRGCSKIEKLID